MPRQRNHRARNTHAGTLFFDGGYKMLGFRSSRIRVMEAWVEQNLTKAVVHSISSEAENTIKVECTPAEGYDTDAIKSEFRKCCDTLPSHMLPLIVDLAVKPQPSCLST
jgi:hypothetical protein